ncbi:hypothetical protein R1sor_024055 [Riccia sorocarpa]|uniref:Reverse transcriptase zinc-binding domain-containing protein n=1 Tax=Riccia sorocarpa TaxID=122646 RepID=A0ABD3GTF6_9MARC
MDVGAGPSERESEEERIWRELEILFGPDVSSDSIGSEEEAVNTENWPPVTSLSPEELYYHLETEGLLRLPLTIEKLIPLDDNGSGFNPRFWGEWKTEEVKLVRDEECTDRIKYKTETRQIDGGAEVFVSRLWSGKQVPSLVGFGALLEGDDGVYRAGIEIAMLTVVQEVGLIKQAISTLHLDVHNLQLNIENQASEFGSQFNVLKEMVEVHSGTTDPSKLLGAVEEHFTTQMHQLREEQQSSGKMVVLLEEGLRQLQVQLSTQSVEIAVQTKLLQEAGCSSSTPTLKVTEAITTLEEKMRVYMDSSRVALATSAHDQDMERMARQARSLNLRIVGLPETPDENTRALVLDLFQDTLGVSDVGVDHVSRIGRSETNRTVLKGGSDTWESVDIIALVETWEWQGQNGLDISGFSRVQTIFNSKWHSQGRGFGGIIIWARDGIGVNIQVELTDPDNQFICLRLSDEDPSFFIIAYFAPVGAPDGEYFLHFASVCGLSVLNGTHQFPDTHGFTFTTPGGSSVIDYMLVSDTAWGRVSSFRLGPFVPESDHCPLFCEISGFRTRRRMRRVLVDRGWSTWNAASKTRYTELVNAKLQEDHSDDMVKISEFLVLMAGKVRHKSKDQSWFTSECSQARQKAISSPPEVKHEEFRAYKNLIKAKRREFVRKQQLLLTEELSREPRLFWTRLKTKQKGSELGDQELLEYVGRLYSFNDVEVMPYLEGPTCLFSVQEVTFAVNKLSTGIDFTSNLSWASCCKSRVAVGLRALFSLWGRCLKVSLLSWPLRRRLFDTLVLPALLYGVPIWGPSLAKTNWAEIELVHKKFLQVELGVRPQIPYALLLAETGRVPLEIEALFLTIQFAQRLKSQPEERYSYQAWRMSRVKGWYSNLCQWSVSWGVLETEWDSGEALRELLVRRAVGRLWESPSSRLQYYCRDTTRLYPYREQHYLSEDLPLKMRQLIARYRVSSHTLSSEVGRWSNTPRENRLCELCDEGKIESEYHVLIACPYYDSIRIRYDIRKQDLRDFFLLPPRVIGDFITLVDQARTETLKSRHSHTNIL